MSQSAGARVLVVQQLAVVVLEAAPERAKEMPRQEALVADGAHMAELVCEEISHVLFSCYALRCVACPSIYALAATPRAIIARIFPSISFETCIVRFGSMTLAIYRL